jgi:phytoene synthase
MDTLYNKVCMQCSKLVTNQYSTSFSLGIRMFSKEIRLPICAVYGFVRFADEIVDTFHDSDKRRLLHQFRADTYRALEEGVSLNPILHSFQQVVRKYNIPVDLIDAFLDSMEMDLDPLIFDEVLLKKYIYGSAEVIGLMCLKIFVHNDEEKFEYLKNYACTLGSVFQKINFLRDMKSDFEDRGRVYFPGVDFSDFSEADKKIIENDIHHEFTVAYEGIKKLPANSRLGVYCAYKYYLNLFYKIRSLPASAITEKRIRVSDKRKLYLLTTSMVQNQFGLL